MEIRQLQKKFVTQSTLVTTGLAVVLYTLLTLITAFNFQTVHVLFIFLSYILSIIFTLVLIWKSKKQPQSFNPFFFSLSGLKILYYILFFVIYIYNNSDHSYEFVTVFGVTYITYSVHEIGFLLNFLKNK